MAQNVFSKTSSIVNALLIKVFDLSSINTGREEETVTPANFDELIAKALGDIGINASYAIAYANFVRTEVERKRYYKEYERMDDESEVITTALDIYAEDATDFDTFVGARIWVSAADEEFATAANNVLKRLKIDKNLPRVARNLAKFGDFFLRCEAKKGSRQNLEPGQQHAEGTSKGIERVDTSYHPRDVMPIIKDNKLLGYWVTDDDADVQNVNENNLFAPWDFVHFAIPGDSNFVSNSDIEKRDTMQKRGCVVEYGQSLLKAARKPYRRSKLMHDILAIARMTRSPLKRVFKVKTNSASPVASIATLAMFKKTMEKIGGIDKVSDDMSYDELINIITQDIYIPLMKDDKGDYSFDHIGGDVDVTNIVDIELFDNRLYMSLRIPKEFLNFGEALGDKATLLLKDIRYAKRIRRLQNAIRSGVKEMLFIHFAHLNKQLAEDDFEINMASTSISDDLQRLDYLSTAVSTADALIRMLTSFGEQGGIMTPPPDEAPQTGQPAPGEKGFQPKPVVLDRGYLVYYIMKCIVKLPSFDVEKFYPNAKDYMDEAKKPDGVKNAQALVESNKNMIKNMFDQKFKNTLREAVEANIDLEKTYHSAGIPEDLKYDTDGLRTICETMIQEKKKITEDEKE